MTLKFFNVYEDVERASSYAALELAGTYYLAFRDLPEIIREHVSGKDALDFGCGAGRSSRFLRTLGFTVTGVDISRSMIAHALALDPAGDYRLIADGDFGPLGNRRFDLVLSAFAFDNIPEVPHRSAILSGLRELLRPQGRLILICSAPGIYTHEWLSFSTRDFPGNRHARSGETVRIVMKDVPDRRPVLDVLWFREDYLRLFAGSGLELLVEHAPLGRDGEPFAWVSETTVAPWVIYVAKARDARPG